MLIVTEIDLKWVGVPLSYGQAGNLNVTTLLKLSFEEHVGPFACIGIVEHAL